MAENFHIDQTLTKPEQYDQLLLQVEGLTAGEEDLIANLSNIVAALKFGMGFFWVGFYFVKADELVLGPFQGPVACTRIRKGKGVCGTSWQERRTLLVPDVDQFPGHIACSSLSKSEIVIPVFDESGEVKLILDIDSDQPDDFDSTDQQYLEKLTVFISKLINI